MFSKITSVALVALSIAASAVAAPLVVDTPISVVSGQPTVIHWAGGISPYIVKVFALETAPTLVANLGLHAGLSAVWDTDVAPDTVVSFSIEDSAGALAQSAEVTVQW
ncbi:hypothetical protein HYPSUDRAFT_41088 [Hypholoma sublateritium FD-334 SS-4]|uniref:Fibronectin type-III domain-containing protein n=1 Tax=Hypholoma sublateritium (strain FD-334 SS-4) TaxID=945553 RepID=A0A0D2NUA1_HYPSF|nr:hypothetical protein HYPSUDRAFT_41088 [Hypholoma sublateritium FD-334 SS-4]